MAQMIYSGSARRLTEHYGDFLQIQLETHPRTEGVVGLAFLEVQKELLTIVAEGKRLQKSRGQIRGRLRWAHIEFVDGVKHFQNQLLYMLSFNRSMFIYQHLFPDGLTGFKRKSISWQLSEVARMIKTLEDGDDEFHLLVDQLGETYEKMDSVHQELVDIENQQKSLKHREKQVKERWYIAYRSCKRELEILFPTEKRIVDAFFINPPSKKKKSTELEIESLARPGETVGGETPTTRNDEKDVVKLEERRANSEDGESADEVVTIEGFAMRWEADPLGVWSDEDGGGER